MEYIEAYLEGISDRWISGQHIIDCQVTLGQNQLGTSAELTLADPDGSIAARLIDHSLRNGGIEKLQPVETTNATSGDSFTTTPTNQPGDPSAWELAIVKGCIKNGVTDKNQIAYVLATAFAESTMGDRLEELASGAAYEGRQDLGNTTPGDGRKYKGRGLVQTTGKANYAKMGSLLKADLLGKPNLLTQARYAVPALVLGMQRGLYTGTSLGTYINSSKVDFYNARRIVNGLDKAATIAGYAQDKYLPRVASLVSAAGGATNAIQEKPTIAEAKTTDTASAQAPVKGNKLTISVGDRTFEFFHQGTEHSHDGITKIVGQGITWVLNRRTRNKTEKNIKLSELAAKIAKAHKVKLAYEATIDPVYTYIDQTNITDYALLKRECDRSGLFLSESQGILTIKSLQNLIDAQYTAELGYNIISYNIKDTAIDVTADDSGSALMQQEAKVDINPITGQFEQLRVDVDTVRDTSVTGKDKKPTTGALVPGQDAIAAASRARTKRVKGLPSSFSVPLGEDTLQLTPLMAFRTKNLPGTLSRVWLIDVVRHSVAAGITTLECYAPIDVIAPIDSQPVVSNAATGATVSNPKGYIWATKGIITSAMGARSAPLPGASTNHGGTDIGAARGTPVVAGKAGTVVSAAYAGNAGNMVVIQHDDGIKTLYMHLDTIGVRPGAQVTQGQRIGSVGTTGNSTGPHLHYEFRRGTTRLSPDQVGLPVVHKGDSI